MSPRVANASILGGRVDFINVTSMSHTTGRDHGMTKKPLALFKELDKPKKRVSVQCRTLVADRQLSGYF